MTIGESIFSTEEVIFYDTDSGGVVSNIAYLRYVEKARCALFAAFGMDLAGMNETQLFPTVARTEIDYRKPAKLGDEIVVEAKIESIHKARINCHFLIHRKGREEEVFADARQVVVLVKMPAGKPVRPPKEWAR